MRKDDNGKPIVRCCVCNSVTIKDGPSCTFGCGGDHICERCMAGSIRLYRDVMSYPEPDSSYLIDNSPKEKQ
jgi:hypothetical protein